MLDPVDWLKGLGKGFLSIDILLDLFDPLPWPDQGSWKRRLLSYVLYLVGIVLLAVVAYYLTR